MLASGGLLPFLQLLVAGGIFYHLYNQVSSAGPLAAGGKPHSAPVPACACSLTNVAQLLLALPGTRPLPRPVLLPPATTPSSLLRLRGRPPQPQCLTLRASRCMLPA